MTHEEVYEVLSSIGIPIAYLQWPIGNVPPLPYMVYYYPNSSDEYADNLNYQNNKQLNIELYSKTKDFDLENEVRKLLNDNGLTFTTSESYLDSEEMFEILFETEVLINVE